MTDKFLPRGPADLIDLVRGQPLAWIVSGDLQATVLPVQLECDAAGKPLRLLGHFGRNNPQWSALARSPRAKVLLLGPHGYISPSWYADRSQAPTWNYAYAQFEVEVEIRDTPQDADALLRRLAGEMEAGRPAAWAIEDMGERYARLSHGIVGFHARIVSVGSRFKLGQDERDDVFADILRGLQLTQGDALADWMRRFADRPAGLASLPTVPVPSALDPDIMRFIDDVRDRGRALTAGRSLSWPERRVVAEQSRLPWQQGGPQMASTEERVIDTEAGPVRLRFYRPLAGSGQAAMVYMHGGGWALFSIDTHDRLMREYAARSGMVVVGVDYALAPEARYPVALNQVVGVVRWLRAHAGELGIDADRLALGGDSAGGSLSMGTALKLRDAGEGDAVKAILSIYGGFSPECSPASRQRYGTPDDMLTADEVDEFWANYVGHIGDRRDPYLVPVLAALQGLPPVFLLVAECDVLAEQNMLMAGCLLEAGVAVKVKVYPGAPHSFIEAMGVSALASQAIDDGAQWLRSTLG
ncbi:MULTISPECIES: alpha/beta hydrolase fold domain-containing protein [unclassified Duganella]|uniref:alpha/beta hydrolase fold domain-containing protein n=1 Tax=unclassified Duganella TaxID=2636909 RepID=UPI0008872842|nr:MULTISPECIES: alpha/beta hydrolase fold domain-containing protein [unclassified Duganella]SDF56706.1 Acetyl esterase/lipase [Duganella sp. OV458]SDI71479.1 Acetyl esterase/lipase [Duganella sp. OV510]